MGLLLVFLLVIASACGENLVFSIEPEERITSGYTANISDFSYQVGINSNGDWYGGSLISATYILTAARGVYSVPPTKVVAYMGSATKGSGTSRTAQWILVHEAYNINTYENDVALIRIISVPLSSTINIIPLPTISNTSLFEGEIVTASGWGKSTETGSYSTTLLAADFTVISNAECAQTFGCLVKNSTICVSTVQTNSPCLGDLGGPVVLRDQKLLIGVISFVSAAGCTVRHPVGISRVTNFRSWIQKNSGI